MALRVTSNSTSSLTVPVPGGIAADDICILIATCDTAAAVFETADWPAGFAELAQADVTRDGQTCAVGWKRLVGTESGNFTFGSPGASIGIIQCLVFSGRHTTDPPVISSNAIDNTALSSPVTVTANGVTAVAGDDLVWISVPDVTANNAGDGHSAVPSGFTEQLDMETGFHNMCSATKENVSAGATGTLSGTFNMTSGTAGYAAWTVRIPSAGGGGGGTIVDRVAEDAITVVDSFTAERTLNREGVSGTIITEGETIRSTLFELFASEDISFTEEAFLHMLRSRLGADGMEPLDEVIKNIVFGDVRIVTAVLDDFMSMTEEAFWWYMRERLQASDSLYADQTSQTFLRDRAAESNINTTEELLRQFNLTRVLDEEISIVDSLILLLITTAINDGSLILIGHDPSDIEIGHDPRIVSISAEQRIEIGGYRL